MEDKRTSIGGGKIVFQLFDYLKHQKELNINGAKAIIFWQLATVNCQDYQFTVARRDNMYIYFMPFVGFCVREEVRKKLIKNAYCLVDGKKKKKFDARCVVKLCLKIDKVTF